MGDETKAEIWAAAKRLGVLLAQGKKEQIMEEMIDEDFLGIWPGGILYRGKDGAEQMLKAVAALGGSRPGVRTELVEDDFEAVRTGDHFAYVVDHWKQYDKDDQITAEFRVMGVLKKVDNQWKILRQMASLF